MAHEQKHVPLLRTSLQNMPVGRIDHTAFCLSASWPRTDFPGKATDCSISTWLARVVLLDDWRGEEFHGIENGARVSVGFDKESTYLSIIIAGDATNPHPVVPGSGLQCL